MLNFSMPCLFGLEGLAANELRHLGLREVKAENGRVRFQGEEADIPKVNLRSRFGERLLIDLGTFPAASFDELFEGVRALPWERFIPRRGAFPVKGYSLNSVLHSVPDCQKIIKKAISRRLGGLYKLEWLPEDGETYQVQFALMKDTVTLSLDTSGVGLHKRGYRPAQVQAPLRETLAAAMVDLAAYRGWEDFCDPFCGSGTVVIEAALAAKGRAPGLNRRFAAENWVSLNPDLWEKAREEAKSREFHGQYRLFASDIDPEAVEIAKKNARRAGVEDLIRFSVADATAFAQPTESGILVSNPPYGERLLDVRQAEALVRAFGRQMRRLPHWQVNLISSDADLEHVYGAKARRVRKLYNGMIKCGYYQF